MKSKELKSGTKFQWETKDKENLMIAIVGHQNPRGTGDRYFIFFFGLFIYTCKGLKSLEKRLAKLIMKGDMESMVYDEEYSPI